MSNLHMHLPTGQLPASRLGLAAHGTRELAQPGRKRGRFPLGPDLIQSYFSYLLS
jgi:hypothetical protein